MKVTQSIHEDAYIRKQDVRNMMEIKLNDKHIEGGKKS